PARRQLPRARRRGACARRATPRGLGPRARARAHAGARRAPPAGARRAAAPGVARGRRRRARGAAGRAARGARGDRRGRARRRPRAGRRSGCARARVAGGRVGGRPPARRPDRRGAARRRGPVPARDDHAFFYDEWGHLIGDYRSRWCRLTEVGVAGDAGEFFGWTLADYARLLPEVRRQSQRIRPDMYRSIRGLEDGEDFDLNATIDARIDVRARRAPSTRLYRSRVREARDVATLFLLDMSASTDEPLAPAGTDGRAGRRIIDALREAL